MFSWNKMENLHTSSGCQLDLVLVHQKRNGSLRLRAGIEGDRGYPLNKHVASGCRDRQAVSEVARRFCGCDGGGAVRPDIGNIAFKDHFAAKLNLEIGKHYCTELFLECGPVVDSGN